MNIEKYNDIILAGAIGDAFGYLVEFDDLLSIKNKYGEEGIKLEQFENLTNWVVSDDTQMTLFCWDVVNIFINKKEVNSEEINRNIYLNYLDWQKTQFYLELKPKTKLGQYKELWAKRAPGMTCLQALGSNKLGTIEKPINNSKGCGGIMRTAPISFLNLPLEQIFDLGCLQAAITHGHENGYLSSGFFAGLLKELTNGKELNQAIKNNILILKRYNKHESILNYIQNIQDKIKNPSIYKEEEISDFIGEGWVGEEALGVALYTFAKGRNFKEVIELATNHQGDSDSTASLACQLYAAQNGLPQEIKNQINKLDIVKVFNYLSQNLDKQLASKTIHRINN